MSRMPPPPPRRKKLPEAPRSPVALTPKRRTYVDIIHDEERDKYPFDYAVRNPAPQKVVVTANIWRDSAGNSYHVAQVLIHYPEGIRELESEVTYGYGTQYLQTARDMLIEDGVIPPTAKTLYHFFPTAGVKYLDKGAEYVKRKKDLKNFS